MRAMMTLPDEFKLKMNLLLKDEYDCFLESYEKERVQGLRLNLLKQEAGTPDITLPFQLAQIPWCREGFYYGAEDRPGKHPYHEAGVYYIQEPSAMAAVELLDPKPGECVLDLCAAPGGKTSHIASRLGGSGFLLSNEIHPQRAKILSQNVERMGIPNAVVTNEAPKALKARFPGFFDKIVVDAPCSGEGMFRKDETAREEWSPDHVALCAGRQQEILQSAAAMLKAGGRMVYSTCTFSPEENEGTIEQFLNSHPEFSVEEIAGYPELDSGRPEWIFQGRRELLNTRRIWPHKTEGEGHYLAVLKKEETGEEPSARPSFPAYLKDKKLLKEFQAFCTANLNRPEVFLGKTEYVLFGEQLYLVPPEMKAFDGLKIQRAGLHMGTFKKNRFEPAHALSHCLKESQAIRYHRMTGGDQEVFDYLNGQALPAVLEEEKNGSGWTLMTVDGYPLGWAKLAGGIYKNHYPKGLRIAR